MTLDHVLLTIRGSRQIQDLDAARKLHNETAGSPEGIAACRALGDLSHKVFVAANTDKLSDARADELFFMDIWRNAEGLQQFFSNKMVQEQGGRLFSEKRPDVWMPATGALTFHLPPPGGKPGRFVGILRGRVKSPHDAIAAFREGMSGGIAEARKRGHISHDLYVKLEPPAADGSAEILGYDLWYDLEGMLATYQSEAMSGMANLFTGRPSGSIWQPAPGAWNEW